MNIRSWSMMLGAVSLMGLAACTVTTETNGSGGSGGSGGSSGNVGGAGGTGGAGGQGGAGMCVGCAEAIDPMTDPSIPFCNTASDMLYTDYIDCICGTMATMGACQTECADLCDPAKNMDSTTCADCRNMAGMAGGACNSQFVACSGDIP